VNSDLDGDAMSPSASANDADHSLNDATVSQWKPSSDVTPGSPSHCRSGKYTSTVHPINLDTVTQFVYNNYPCRWFVRRCNAGRSLRRRQSLILQ